MKVYELISILMAAPAGADVVVCLSGTLNSTLEHAQVDGDLVSLSGGDAEMIDSNGESIGWISAYTDASEEEA